MRTTYHEVEDKIILNYEADVEAVIDACQAERAAESHFAKPKDMHKVMTVPEVVMLDIRNRYGWDFMNKDHWPMVKKILTGPEYAQWRVTKRKF